jgi:hypothetical protein
VSTVEHAGNAQRPIAFEIVTGVEYQPLDDDEPAPNAQKQRIRTNLSVPSP